MFHFLEYDKRFELARAQESPDFSGKWCMEGCTAVGLTAKAKAQYEQYLQEHMAQIASAFIRQKRGKELEWLLHTYPLTPDQRELFAGLMDQANASHASEILSMLMEYQKVHFPSRRRSFDL